MQRRDPRHGLLDTSPDAQEIVVRSIFQRRFVMGHVQCCGVP
jgi:hypothetical protein